MQTIDATVTSTALVAAEAESRLLPQLDQVYAALMQAATIDEVKVIRDKAEALRHYTRQAKLSLEMQNRCAEIKLRAERRAGEMLREMPKATPSGSNQHKEVSRGGTHPPTLGELGVSRNQSSRWQTVAAMPAERFEGYIADTKAKGKELTTAGLVRAGSAPSKGAGRKKEDTTKTTRMRRVPAGTQGRPIASYAYEWHQIEDVLYRRLFPLDPEKVASVLIGDSIIAAQGVVSQCQIWLTAFSTALEASRCKEKSLPPQ